MNTGRRLALYLALAWIALNPAPSFADASKVLVSAPSRSLTWFPATLAKEKGFFKDDMAAATWSATGIPGAEALRATMEEVQRELKLDRAPDASQAFDWSFVKP